jgi:ornithine carbamoyltransferase
MAGSYATVIVARTSDDDLRRLTQQTTIPVVNAHSPSHRPCQALADLLALRDSLGGLEARRLAYIGDPTESRDLIETAAASGMDIRISPAAGIDPEPALTAARTIADRAGGQVATVIDPVAAAEDADAIYIKATTTATIAPTGRAISCYDLAVELLAAAATDAVVLHDPPTHPGPCIAPLLVRHPNAKLRSKPRTGFPAPRPCSSPQPTTSHPTTGSWPAPLASRPTARRGGVLPTDAGIGDPEVHPKTIR